MKAGSSRSDTTALARGATGTAALAAAAFLLIVAAVARPSTTGPVIAPADSGLARLAGENGLYVRIDGDSMTARWITAAPGPGSLQAMVDGELRHDTTTPADTAHSATFRIRGNDPILLRYGSAADTSDRHETAIDPRTGRRRPDVRFSGADSIFVVSDVHGEFDTLTHVLRNAGLIDDALHWSGREAHLVVLGDMTDRGQDVTRVLWLLYRLEREAEAADGDLHVVLGNHELMVMLGDLRYVSPKELEIARLHGVTYDQLFDPRHSVLGRWLASRPALIRIDDVLFAHGGVSAAWLAEDIESVDDSLETFVNEELFHRWADTTFVPPLDSAAIARRNDFFWDDASLFWYRGYAQEDTLGTALGAVLDRYDATLHVVGHTPGPAIRQRYGGRLIAVNTVPFAAELLLLVRVRHGWERYRMGTSGAARSLETGGR